MMRKALLFMFVISSMLLSCKKEPTSNYLEVTINGNSYREVRPINVAIGNYAGDFCNSNPNVGWNIMEIDLSNLFFGADLACYEDEIDFKNSVTGSYSVNDGINFINPCNSNLDIVLTFDDNTISNPALTLQSSNRVHTVTRIDIYSQTSTYVEYTITGEFSCSFKSDENKIYSVTGKYQTLISVRK